jgi:2-alkenal reductase
MGVQGIIVMRVFPNSPAGQAGVRGVDTDARTLGDVIVNVSGKPAKRIPDLTDELERIGVGGKIQLTLKRNDSEHTVELDVIDAIRPAPAK